MDLGSAPERAGRTVDRSRRADREWIRARVDRGRPGGDWPVAEGVRWGTDEWAPASTVRRPLVRLGRWTLLYRRPGC